MAREHVGLHVHYGSTGRDALAVELTGGETGDLATATPLPVETNVAKYWQDSITAHGVKITPVDTTVQASGATALVTPAANHVLRVHRATVQLRTGGAACEAAFRFGASGSVCTAALTAEGQPGGFNLGRDYLEGALGATLSLVLSGPSDVLVTVFYEEIDPADEGPVV